MKHLKAQDAKHYDFSLAVERRGTGAAKWDLIPDGRLPFWVADMDFAVAPEITSALQERAEHPVFGYTLPPESLYEAFLEFQLRRHGRSIAREHCVVVPGVMPALRTAVELLSKPGDSIVLQPPVYPPFFDAIKAKGRQVAENPLVLENDVYRMDLAGLEELFQAGARLMLLCSPHNPVGRVWSETELTELAELCRRYKVTVISDEIHADIRHAAAPEHAAASVGRTEHAGHAEHAAASAGGAANSGHAESRAFLPFDAFLSVNEEDSGDGAQVISLVSPSKTFNIPGASVAFAVIPNRPLRRRFRAGLKANGLDHPHIFGMISSEAGYRFGDTWLNGLGEQLHANLALLDRLCSESSLKPRLYAPEISFVAWVGFHDFLSSAGLTDEEFQEKLRSVAELELSHGPDFGTGGSGFQRINFATSPALLEECFQRLERLV
ncbi:MAG: aminotransferase class I/II-fold pyridoxal phosphate-dependent enzyme [Spirochaetaceae bacterium]|nr:MAG: aminotransferase class I/II-fold pyridoxal phosphate-dependent enzyme [Spirochaetaceae bacterium]